MAKKTIYFGQKSIYTLRTPIYVSKTIRYKVLTIDLEHWNLVKC